jgi:hypothetical protein
MARPQIRNEFAAEVRKGIYIMPETRDRLNDVKKRLAQSAGAALSQDDVIELGLALIDHVGTDSAVLLLEGRK